MQNNVWSFAKRSLSLSKTQAVMGLFLAAIGLFTIVWLTFSPTPQMRQSFFLSVSFLGLWDLDGPDAGHTALCV